MEAIEKRIGDLASSVDSIKASMTSATKSEGLTMDQAIDCFKKGKYGEAKAAFAKLQSSSPDDARVWYYSALATGHWKGVSERMVVNGVAKEKTGTPDRAQINAAFAGLSASTGKDWLAFYRSRAAQ